MKLSKLPKPFTFTLKHDFNMSGFLVKLNPDHSFETKVKGSNEFEAPFKDHRKYSEEDIADLIKKGDTVTIYYRRDKKLDVYNFKDEFEVLGIVGRY